MLFQWVIVDYNIVKVENHELSKNEQCKLFIDMQKFTYALSSQKAWLTIQKTHTLSCTRSLPLFIHNSHLVVSQPQVYLYKVVSLS